jgi:hypothetical protein
MIEILEHGVTSINNDEALAATKSTLRWDLTGDGGVIPTGTKYFAAYAPWDGEIEEAVVTADQSGSIVFDVWVDSFANYPPTVADTITASAKPTLSSEISSKDTTLTDWTKTFSKGDAFIINVDSASTVTEATLTLAIKKTGV